MIGYLKGLPHSQHNNQLILVVNNVGYQVTAEKKILEKVQAHPTKEREIFTYTYVREDTLDLYGFEKKENLHLFEKLISISGIGPKIGIGIFSVGTYEEIVSAISNADIDFFTQVPKLGKKNAQKIIIELKSKLGSIQDLDLTNDRQQDNKDVLVALQSFGFSQNEARGALSAIKDKNASVEEKVKQALKNLGK